MSDNSTPHLAQIYDAKIEKTIPYYQNFHAETLDLIKSVNPEPMTWLDTGCGTGILIEKAVSSFHHTRFVLADPAEAMLTIAKTKLSTYPPSMMEYIQAGTQEIKYPDHSFDVITAIQSHHYLDEAGRKQATVNCFRMLNAGGVYVTFENIQPDTDKGIQVGLYRWKEFQLHQGKTVNEVDAHIQRFGVEYFPITISEHLHLLKDCGFSTVEILWVSYMQAGFYAIK
jgi:tRNA (cmo5U34)-methyltransferase